MRWGQRHSFYRSTRHRGLFVSASRRLPFLIHPRPCPSGLSCGHLAYKVKRLVGVGSLTERGPDPTARLQWASLTRSMNFFQLFYVTLSFPDSDRRGPTRFFPLVHSPPVRDFRRPSSFKFLSPNPVVVSCRKVHTVRLLSPLF